MFGMIFGRGTRMGLTKAGVSPGLARAGGLAVSALWAAITTDPSGLMDGITDGFDGFGFDVDGSSPGKRSPIEP